MEHLEHDWDRQREQLSALLDNELDEQERAELTAHLPTCAECRAELESLRRTRALVRALPQPALPRSFALPLEAAPVQEMPRQAVAPARPVVGPARRPTSAPPTNLGSRRRSPVRTLQWISSIAAVLGIILLLSSFFSTPLFNKQSYITSANAPSSAGTDQLSSTPVPSTRTNETQTGKDTPAPTANPPGSTPQPTAEQDEGKSLSNPASASDTFISITGLGALLLILSACGFAIAWAIRRRW